MILKGAHDTQPQRNELEYLGIFMTFFLLTITNRARSEKFVPAFFLVQTSVNLQTLKAL